MITMFIGLSNIESALKKIEAHRQAAQTALSAMQHEIGNIDPRFSSSVIAEKTKEIRAKHGEVVRANFVSLKELSDSLKTTRQFWSSTPFVLSTRAASATANGHQAAAPKDAAVEELTRLRMMQEFKAIPTELLRLRLLAEKSAVAAGGPAGGLYLASTEYNQRQDEKDYEPVSLDDVELPDQKEALQMLDAAKATETVTEQAFRQSLGQTITPTDRINAARQLAEAGA